MSNNLIETCNDSIVMHNNTTLTIIAILTIILMLTIILTLTNFDKKKLIRSSSEDQIKKRVIDARKLNIITLPKSFSVKQPLTFNPLLNNFSLIQADSYKGAHGLMLNAIFKNGITNVQFYAGPRKGSKFPSVVNFGLQHLLLTLENTIITEEHVLSVAKLYDKGIGSFDVETWLYVARDLKGIMPIKIKALPEGVEVPAGVPLFVMESTDARFSSVLGYLETFMSHLWYPMTVATHSREVKKIIKQYVTETSDNLDSWKFMLHDFGCRGTSSMATAGIGGAAHLVNFYGTDTIPGIEHIYNYYDCSDMPGFSVNATEHSIMTSKMEDGQINVIESLLDEFKKGILSMVIDSYDQYKVTEMLTTKPLLDKVKNRNGKVVLRPDSGEPIEVITRMFNTIERNLGSDITTNSKGYKVLPPYIGIIYGDGLNPNKIEELLKKTKELGWAADNLVFGMGGGLLQKVDRDTCRFAWKCCALEENGIWHDVYKDPCDGKGTSESKASLKGRQKVVKIEGVYNAVREDDPEYAHLEDEMKLVYLNGNVIKTYTFDEVRANAEVITNNKLTKIVNVETYIKVNTNVELE
jgi:nicotinamide phosphoribosyltransferase